MPYVKGVYIGPATFRDTNGEEAELDVWQNPETGNYVAIDMMERDAGTNSIPDPYTPGVRIVFEDTFSGLPK